MDLPSDYERFAISGWVHIFRELGGKVDFLSPDANDSEKGEFGTAVLTWPLILITLGLVVSVSTVVGLCCCRRPKIPTGARKPSAKPVLCLAILIFAMILVSSVACLVVGNSSFKSATGQLVRADRDLTHAVEKGKLLEGTGDEILKSLGEFQSKCPEVWNSDQANSDLKDAEDQIKAAKAELSHYIATVEPLVEKTRKVKESQKTYGLYLVTFLSLPIVLVTVTCFCIISAVIAIRRFGGSGFANCCDCFCLKLGSLGISLAILLAVIVGSAQTAMGIGVSSFCAKADRIVLNYARHFLGNDSKEFKAAQYYISAEGENPIMEELNKTKIYFAQANATFEQLDTIWPHIQAAASSECGAWSPETIKNQFPTIDYGISTCQTIVDAQNIYPYYNVMIHKNICGAVIDSLGWLASIQLVGGLILLPAMACASASFFSRWSTWKASLEKRKQSERLIEIGQMLIQIGQKS